MQCLYYNTVNFLYKEVQCSLYQRNTVQRNKVQWNTVQFSTIQFSVLDWSATQCSVIQCSLVKCSTIQNSAIHYSTVGFSSRRPRFACSLAGTIRAQKLIHPKWEEGEHIKLGRHFVSLFGSFLAWNCKINLLLTLRLSILREQYTCTLYKSDKARQSQAFQKSFYWLLSLVRMSRAN